MYKQTDVMSRDLLVLTTVGQMYLTALELDSENEMLTLPEGIRVTEVREAVERWKIANSLN